MSLLLDALRRAAAAKQGPAGDRYTVPRRGDTGPAPARPAPAGGGDDATPAASGGDEALDLELELREDGADDGQQGAPQPGPVAEGAADGGNAAAARAVLHGGARRGGDRMRAVLALGAGVLVLAAAFAAGTWYYYRLVYTDVTRDLASVRPQSSPGPAPAEAAGGGTAAGDDGVRAEAGADEAVAAGAPRPGASAADGEAVATVADADAAAGADATAPGDGAAEAEGEAVEARGDVAAAEQQVAGADAAADEGDGAGTGAAAGEAAAGSGAESSAGRRDAGDGAAAETTASGQDVQGQATPAKPRHAQPMVRASEGQPLMEALQAGYEALQGGDLDAAADAYRRARRLAPDNRDALLGAAAVAQRRGEAGEARALYRRILDDHPRDPYARAALAGLEGTSDPRRSESELKMLLRERPQAASLHFALGNIYAADSRWADAQEAYFEAVRAAPGDAAYAYNLAVALDHLGQRDAARRHYEQAVRLADGRATGVPLDAVERRLRQLR